MFIALCHSNEMILYLWRKVRKIIHWIKWIDGLLLDIFNDGNKKLWKMIRVIKKKWKIFIFPAINSSNYHN